MKQNSFGDLKTEGIILRRTDYGEADRILNIITPTGKISAIAKGVRRPKSKLASGIELFAVNMLQIHFGHKDLGIITSAKMLEYFGNIIKDYDRMQLTGLVLKKISTISEHTTAPEFYDITKQCLTEINRDTNIALIESWFWLNLLKASGEEINLYRDSHGQRLSADERYSWSIQDSAFIPNEQGDYGELEIKLLRFISTANLTTAKRLKVTSENLQKTLNLAKIVAKN